MTKSTVWSTEKKKGGAYALDADAVTALTAVTTANTISEVLDILSEVVKRSHVVSAGGIGKVTRTDA